MRFSSGLLATYPVARFAYYPVNDTVHVPRHDGFARVLRTIPSEPMPTNKINRPSPLRRYSSFVLTLIFFIASLSAPPAFAQDQSQPNQQLEQLKQAWSQGKQAANDNNWSTAYQHFERALELANAADQQGAVRQIQTFMVAAKKQLGNEAYKSGDFEGALAHYETALEYDSTMSSLYLNRGQTLRKLDRVDAALESLTTAIQKGNASGNQRIVQEATAVIQDHFVAQASEMLNVQDPTQAQADEALGYLDEMNEYVEPDARSYFYRATALYHKDQYEDAIAMARQGLEIFDGSRSDEAKYHFVIGESQVALGNTESAKESFQQAAYGDYAQRANHYLETL